MGKLHFLRHAESTHNASHGEVEEVDADLSPLGEQQAMQVTGEFDLVLCSPMRRAKKTVELSQLKYKEIKFLPDSREVRFTTADLMEGENYALPETIENASERVERLIEQLKKELTSGKSILVSTHSAIIRLITSGNLLLDGEDDDGGIRIKNAEIIELNI